MIAFWVNLLLTVNQKSVNENKKVRLLHQIYFIIVDAQQFLTYVDGTMDNGVSVNRVRVLVHNPPPSKLQGRIPPFPSSSKDLRQAMRPSLCTKLYGSYLEHEYFSA